MKSYSPLYMDPRNIPEGNSSDIPDGFKPATDAELISYVENYWQEFRSVVEQYFGSFSKSLPLYANYPYKSTIVRLGPNGVIIAHKPAHEFSVNVLRPEEFNPPLEDFNLFTIRERLDAHLISFNFRFVSYDETEARTAGARAAFEQALNIFWYVLEPIRFESLCQELVIAEGVHVANGAPLDGHSPDLIGRVYLDEPGSFVREEVWGFTLKHYRVERPSAAVVREAEERLERNNLQLDVLCLMSSGDLTSIGRNVAIKNPRIRVWDRAVLGILLHRHPEIMERYFEPYAHALVQIQADWSGGPTYEAKFKATLQTCPTGQRHFQIYENLGVELLRFLFPIDLGEPRVQSRTADGVERRDVVSRNNRNSRFFQRVSSRFDADFVIWDFKNYGDPITGEVVNDVATYANPALGRFIIIVSRKGGNESARKAQIRRFQIDKKMILVVSDQQLLEMIQRKESQSAPEDLLEDLLDELMVAC